MKSNFRINCLNQSNFEASYHAIIQIRSNSEAVRTSDVTLGRQDRVFTSCLYTPGRLLAHNCRIPPAIGTLFNYLSYRL